MQIEITKEQYQTLVNAMQVSGVVYGVLGDMVDKKYKQHSDALDDLENTIFAHANDFDFAKWVEKFDGKNVAGEELLNKAIDDLRDYDEYVFWEGLVEHLAQKELDKTYDRAARRVMGEEGCRHEYWKLLDKWWTIIDKQGTDCLEAKQ